MEFAKLFFNNTPKHKGVIASGHCAEKVEDQIREAQTVIDAGVDAYVFISSTESHSSSHFIRNSFFLSDLTLTVPWDVSLKLPDNLVKT